MAGEAPSMSLFTSRILFDDGFLVRSHFVEKIKSLVSGKIYASRLYGHFDLSGQRHFLFSQHDC